MAALDKDIPEPKRMTDQPFLMAVKTCSRSRAAARWPQAAWNASRVRSAGGRDRRTQDTGKSVVTGLKCSASSGRAWRATTSAFFAGMKEPGGRGQVIVAPRHQAAHQVQGQAVRLDQGRGGTAVLQGLPAPVLLPHDRRDGLLRTSAGVEMVMPGTTWTSKSS